MVDLACWTRTVQDVESADLAARWLALESSFEQSSYLGDRSIRVYGRPHPSGIVLVAGHAVQHTRNGDTKLADRGTGGLAILLGQLLSIPAVVDVSGDTVDANFSREHQLKNIVAALAPSTVIDLHGMRQRDAAAADLGLGAKNPIPVRFVEALHTSSLYVTTGRWFSAANTATVTRWAQSHGWAACQVEIGANYRPPNGNTNRLGAMAALLAGALTTEMT